MKYNVFDVVELTDNSKAIITEVCNKNYKAKIVGKGFDNETRIITENDIANDLYKKQHS